MILRSRRIEPVLDIPEVERQPFVPRGRVASVDLRPAGQARRHVVTVPLFGRVAREVLDRQRPRPDEAHLSPQDVHQLGQLVDAEGAEPAAQWCQALGVGQQRPVGGAAVGHGAELHDGEWVAVASGSSLTEEDRRADAEPDHDSEQRHDRRENDGRRHGEGQIERPFAPEGRHRRRASFRAPWPHCRLHPACCTSHRATSASSSCSGPQLRAFPSCRLRGAHRVGPRLRSSRRSRPAASGTTHWSTPPAASRSRPTSPRRRSCTASSAGCAPTSCTRTTPSRASTAASPPAGQGARDRQHPARALRATDGPPGSAGARVRARAARRGVQRRRAGAERRGHRDAAPPRVPASRSSSLLGNGIDLDRFRPRRRRRTCRDPRRARRRPRRRRHRCRRPARAREGLRRAFEAARDRRRASDPTCDSSSIGPTDTDKGDPLGAGGHRPGRRAIGVAFLGHAPRRRAAVPGDGHPRPRVPP